MISGTGLSEVTGFINSRFSNPADDHPDIQYFFGGFLAACARTGQVRGKEKTKIPEKKRNFEEKILGLNCMLLFFC